MIRINLLPHREMRRERRKRDFRLALAASAILGVLVCAAVAAAIDAQVDAQRARNEFIRAENARLDQQIRQIATLRQEMEALRARQSAVENLQRDRTVPVHVLGELVRITPEGVFFKTIRQDEGRLSLVGVAQSNEKVSALLKALAYDSEWLERPELVEIRGANLSRGETRSDNRGDAKDGRKVYEFSLNALVRASAGRQAVAAR